MTCKNDVTKTQSDFVEFMKAHKIPKDDKIIEQTHTVMGELHPILYKFPGKFHISGFDYDKFLGLYKNVINEGKIPLHIIERPLNVGPIVVDIDIHISEEYEERQYRNYHIEKIVEIYNQVISEMFDVSKDEINAYVYEKSEPTYEEKEKEQYYKDGWHIYYNDIPFDLESRFYIFDRTKQLIIENDIFGDIPITNTYDNICDDSVIIRNGILMSGSSKPNRDPYKLTKIYDYNLRKIPIKDYDNDELIDLKSIRRCPQEDAIRLKNEDDYDIIIKAYEKYTSKKSKSVRQKDVQVHNKEGKLDYEKILLKYGKTPDEKLAISLIQIINPKRWDDYNDWLHLGWTLHSISNDFYGLYDDISRQSPKYQKDCCMLPWRQATDNDNYGYTSNTLRWWAKEDNKDNIDRYNDVIRNAISQSIKDALKAGTHVDIANVVKDFYEGRFKCISIKHNKWCEFQGHNWVAIEGGHSVSNAIDSELRKEFAKMQSIITWDMKNDDSDAMQKKMEGAAKLFKNLGNAGFINSVTQVTGRKMYDNKFMENLDEKPDLIGFNNGIFDLKTGTFRAGLPDDMVSKTTGYDYKEYTTSSKEVKVIEQYFAEVFPNINVRNYILMFIASLFDGKVLQQLVFWTGTGANGKSTTVNLIRDALGSGETGYSDGMSIAMITQRRKGANDASPEMANKKGIRFVIMQEPEKNDVINVGYMKELTGGDKIKARQLYESSIEYQPQFTPVVICNKLPKLSDIEGGTARRLVVVNYYSEFVDKPDATKPNKFKINTNLPNEMKSWKQPFAWWILNIHYKRYRESNYNFIIPEEVKLATDRFKKDSDIFLDFILEKLEKTNNNYDSEPIDWLYKLFREYYKETCGLNIPDKKEFIAYFERNDYKMEKKKLYGLRIIDTFDNDK